MTVPSSSDEEGAAGGRAVRQDEGLESRPRDRDVSSSAFQLLTQQTGSTPSANQSGLLASAVFTVAALLLLIALRQGADLRQLLIAGIAVAVSNLLIAVTWGARARRRR